jgi:hypothetical protein
MSAINQSTPLVNKASETQQQLNAAPHTQKMSRTLHIQIQGSLANLALQGQSAATWRLVDGNQLAAFGTGNEIDVQSGSNQLRTALLTKATFIQEHSTFPVPLGIMISCVPCMEYTDLGQKYTYTVLPYSRNTVMCFILFSIAHSSLIC